MSSTKIISPSPHLHGGQSTPRIMRDVVIALIPAFAFSVYIYGLNAVWLTGIAIAACMLFEWLIERVMLKRKSTLGDWSAVITGTLLAFNLPSGISPWLIVLGALVAIGVGKMSFGGLGRNLFNPALVGRVFLLISFPVQMTVFPTVVGMGGTDAEAMASVMTTEATMVMEAETTDAATGATIVLDTTDAATGATAALDTAAGGTVDAWAGATATTAEAVVDATSGATPLAYVKAALAQGKTVSEIAPDLHLGDMLLGFKDGSMGEIGALALLLGGLYLLFRKVITWHIPVFVLGSMAAFAGILWGIDPEHYVNPLFHLVTGGAILGAVFMATDYVTSPMTKKGMAIYGIGIGVITMLVRLWGAYPEGMSFAILIMNATVPLIDMYVKPSRFGKKTK